MKLQKFFMSALAVSLMALVFTGCEENKLPGDQSGMTFQLSIADVTSSSVELTVIPSDLEQTYYADVFPMDLVNGKTDDDIISMVTARMKDEYLKTGQQTFVKNGLLPETSYMFFALGFSDGKPSSQLTKYNFITIPKSAEKTEPVIDMELYLGDEDGYYKDHFISVSVSCTSKDLAEAYILCDGDGVVDKLVQEGKSLEEIVAATKDIMQEFDEDWLSITNLQNSLFPDGLLLNLKDATPSTKYYCLMVGTSISGGQTIILKDVTTEEEVVRNTNLVELDEAGFCEKIYDYENNTEWKYEGSRPAMIDFYASWCLPCKKMTPIVDAFSLEYSDRIDFYGVDTDACYLTWLELCKIFDDEAGYIPCFVFINAAGEFQSVVGEMTEEDMREKLESILK